MKKNERGITLIALIITVIVLLILAGVAISIAINGGDIFGKASTARSEWNISVEQENTAIQEAMQYLNIAYSGTTQNVNEEYVPNLEHPYGNNTEAENNVVPSLFTFAPITEGTGKIDDTYELGKVADASGDLKIADVPTNKVKITGLNWNWIFKDVEGFTTHETASDLIDADRTPFVNTLSVYASNMVIPAVVKLDSNYELDMENGTEYIVSEIHKFSGFGEDYWTENLTTAISMDSPCCRVLDFVDLHITLPDTITKIDDRAFYKLRETTEINLQPGVKWIGDHAFERTKISEINLSNSLEYIGDYAFQGSDLQSISIPANVTFIGDEAFSVCQYLAHITVNANNTVYDSRGNCNAIIKTSENKLLFGCESTTFPNTITSIGSHAFYYTPAPSNLIIPGNIIVIGEGAFSMNDSITSVVIQNGTTTIEDATFAGTENCDSITIPASVTYIGSYVFNHTKTITINFEGTRAQWNAFNVILPQTSNDYPYTITVICSDD